MSIIKKVSKFFYEVSAYVPGLLTGTQIINCIGVRYIFTLSLYLIPSTDMKVILTIVTPLIFCVTE